MRNRLLHDLTTLLTAADRKGNFKFPWPQRFTLTHSRARLAAGFVPTCLVSDGHVATVRLTFRHGPSFDLCAPCHLKLIP